MSDAPISRRALLAVIRPWIASAVVVLALALAVRFLVIWGMASLGVGILALITGWRPLAVLACGLGLWGVVLYNAGAAAFGLLFGLLRLVRADAGLSGPDPERPQGRQQG